MSNINFVRFFRTSINLGKKVVPHNLKGKKASSQHWLVRQLKDPYVEKAKLMNYRCRSAFKLIEIDDRFKILSPGQTIVDCGAAPGSWTQVAIPRVNADNHDSSKPVGTVVAIDRLQIYPIDNAQLFTNMDFTLSENQEKVKSFLNNKLVDIVISDMAPKASGIKSLDQENIITLCYAAFKFALKMSKIDGTLLVKLWQGTGVKELEDNLLMFYDSVKTVKPSSSRSDSAEIFLLSRGFKGIKR